jgi:uncharacterized membrane protein YkvA (DUF1232 family)
MALENLGASDAEFVRDGAAKVTEREVEKVFNRSDEIQRRFHSRGPLKRFLGDARLMLALVRDYWTGSYPRVPFGIIGVVVFTLIYVLNPLDLVPDVLPIIGQLDDAAVVGACLLLIEHDLLAYAKFKQEDTGAAPKGPD